MRRYLLAVASVVLVGFCLLGRQAAAADPVDTVWVDDSVPTGASAAADGGVLVTEMFNQTRG